MKEKQRLDLQMVQLGLEASRERAKALIMAGRVYVDGQKADKPGTLVTPESKVELRGNPMKYVSRGGLKLEKAMSVFPIVLHDKVCMDIGASTGGFTDCMLQNGAVRVYAVDVGYGQLAWSLRCDPRVVNLERTNIRYVTNEQVPEPIDFISVDVSFISLGLVLPVAYTLLAPEGEAVCLIKPQFEAGREKVGKKGVVRDPAVHQEVIEKVAHIAKEIGFCLQGLDYSPVRGPEGNIEYLLYIKKSQGEGAQLDIAQLVSASHENLVR